MEDGAIAECHAIVASMSNNSSNSDGEPCVHETIRSASETGHCAHAWLEQLFAAKQYFAFLPLLWMRMLHK